LRIDAALAHATQYLEARGVETPRVDAEWLVAPVAARKRSQPARGGDVAEAQLQTLLARRAPREPPADALGEWGVRRLTL